MKNIMYSLIVLCFTAISFSETCEVPGWVITSTSISFQALRIPGNYSNGYCDAIYYLVRYSYINDIWQQDQHCPTSAAFKAYCGYSCWGRTLEQLYAGCSNGSIYVAQASDANALIASGYVEWILNSEFPNGGSDPNFAQDFKFSVEFDDPTTQPNPLAARNDGNPALKADPVHINNGEYVLSVTDAAWPGRLLPVVFGRSYGSKRDYNGQMGYGWDFDYNMKVRRLASTDSEPNAIMLLDGRCQRWEYVQDLNDPTLYYRTDSLDDYIKDESGTLKLIKKSGIEYEFDNYGNLAYIRDENGSTLKFNYDAAGLKDIIGPSNYFNDLPEGKYGLIAREYQLTSITNDLNKTIQFEYDANGLLHTITDYANHTWTYTHDPYTNDLTSVEDPNGLITTYEYNYNHHLLTITDPNNQQYIVNQYDYYSRVDQQTYGFGTYTFDYNDTSKTGTLMDRQGHKTKTVYNSAGQIAKDTIYTDDTHAEPNSFTTEYFYNANNQITRTILPDGNSIDCTYNTTGNLTGIFRKANLDEPNDANDPDVIGVVYTYDINFPNKIRTIRDAKGNITTFSYDAKGNVKHITYPTVSAGTPIVRFTYNAYGQVETATAPDGIVTRYEYYTSQGDPNYGRLHYTIVDDGNDPNCLHLTTTYTYDAVGNVKSITDPNGNTVTTAYNANDLPTAVTSPSPFNYVTSLSYNKNKLLASTGKAIGASTQLFKYGYDKLDHLKMLTDPLNHITLYGYTKSEEPNIVTDAESHSTKSEYDERGLLRKVTDANNSDTLYRYNRNGGLAEIEDAHGNITKYDYDVFGRLSCTTYPDNTTEVLTYDKNSNIESKKNRGDQTIYFGYDALNRMIAKRRPNEPNTTFLYDIAGRLTDVNDNSKLTSYYYDRIGRVEEVIDSNDKSVEYQYDELGRRTRLTYPDDSYITYEYDTLSRLTYIRDANNNPLAHYGYDALSRRTLLTLGNDANATYSYDLANRLEYVKNKFTDINNPANNWELRFEYTHDKVGNRLTMTVNSTQLHDYDYDSLYQLTHVDYPAGSTTYHYDAMGNRWQTEGSSTIDYTQNAAGLNQYGSVGGVTYSYDPNGNLTNDGTYKYYYDCENRLIDVNNATTNAHIAHYAYDYRGRRVSKTDYTLNPVRYTLFVYDGDQIIAEYGYVNGQWTLVKKYIYGPGIDEPVCMINVVWQTETIYYYHFDGLGSVIALSKFNGDLVEQCHYDVFGVPDCISSVGNPYKFTGRAYDDETGLYYYRARYYKPSIGRFLQTDPIGYADSLNMYSYCGNNPANWADPSGLCKGSLWNRWERFVQSNDASISLGAFGIGLLESVYDAEAGIVDTFVHPIDTFTGLPTAIANIPASAGQFYSDITSPDPYTYGNALGRLTGTIEFSLATAKLAGGGPSRGGIGPVRAGQAGERAVGLSGPKEAIKINGRTRIPDEVTKTTVIEVKNVKSLTYTKQLRDYAAFAQQNGKTFELYVRSSTKLSGPLKQAINAGDITLKYIPGM